jgi:energy-coupling factor transporter ATP-binding protein EcfA2
MSDANSYWNMLRLNWFRKPVEKVAIEPAIFVKQISFADGTAIDIAQDSIVVLTGPNNVGKSSALRDVANAASGSFYSGPVVRSVEIEAQGTAAQFRELVESRSLKGSRSGTVLIGRHDYELSKIDEELKSSFRGSPVATLFFSLLSAGNRLSLIDSGRREDWTSRAPTDPVQWLDIETEAENEISAAFRKAFGLNLFVNRTAGERIILHVSEDDHPEFQSFRDYMSWISKLTTLQRQGDGMRSFAAVLLSLKIHPKSLVLLDEPEAFLHHPQARKLAELITKDTAPKTQIWLATHSDEVVRGLLDNTNDRIVLVRLDRLKNKTTPKLLKAEQVKTLWTDPLLRTSDVLSALFHELAVICEGETDVRFFRALLDANKLEERLPDLRFYHVGGKDKIVSIVSALKLLNLPVCVIADIDILADAGKFLELFVSMGGSRREVEDDVKSIVRHVGQRKALVDGREAAAQLRKIADSIQTEPKISSTARRQISALAQESSPWERIKEDGYRGFGNATTVQAFDRVYESCKAVGLTINREGELEGLCRDISKKPKSNWLTEALTRDLANDPSLDDARKMLGDLRQSINFARHMTGLPQPKY